MSLIKVNIVPISVYMVISILLFGVSYMHATNIILFLRVSGAIVFLAPFIIIIYMKIENNISRRSRNGR